MKIFRSYVVFQLLLLLSSGCDLFTSSHHNIEDYTPVLADAQAGNLEAVKAAVEKDHSVLTAKEWDDATLVHLAVGQNHKEVAEYLLEAGADVNALTKDKLTPLHMAAQNGNLEIVKLLINRKAKINPVDAKGWTPADRATKWGHPDVAEFLKQQK
jgi:ankyrin repeat protein